MGRWTVGHWTKIVVESWLALGGATFLWLLWIYHRSGEILKNQSGVSYQGIIQPAVPVEPELLFLVDRDQKHFRSDFLRSERTKIR